MTRKQILMAIVALLTVTTFAREPVSTEQLGKEFLNWKFGMFIHFNVATFNNREWANGYEKPSSFKPDKLDCDQWAQTAVSAGMKYAVLTVKHTGGWCLWDSKLTETHAMSAFANYKNGNGDIVREFVNACRKNNLKVGLYYCFPRDFGHPEGKKPLNGLPPEGTDDPVSFVKKQLTELLTNYGPIDLLWCDQYQFNIREHWADITKHIKSLQPDCIIIANNSLDFRDTDIHSYEYPWLMGKGRKALPSEGNTIPSEVCDQMGPGWFYNSKKKWELKSAQEVVEMVRLCNRRKSNYLMNVAPDRSGLIPAHSVKRLQEIGELLGVSGCTGTMGRNPSPELTFYR